MRSDASATNLVGMQTDDPHMTIAKLSALSPAEQAVLDEALTGVTAREVAERLSLSEATVRSHLSSIYVKLGVSGRVALLAQFRASDAVAPHADPPAARRSTAATVAGWSWGVLAVFEGAYALYLLTGALASGGSRTTWLLAIGFAILTVFSTRLARAILEDPSRRRLVVSLVAAAGHLLFAIRGLFIGPVQPFVVVAAFAVGIGLISLLTMRESAN